MILLALKALAGGKVELAAAVCTIQQPREQSLPFRFCGAAFVFAQLLHSVPLCLRNDCFLRIRYDEHKLPDGLLAVPKLRIILVLFHIRQHLLHGLLQELGGHFTGLHTKRKGFLRDFFLQGVHLRSPLPYRSWLTRDV